MIGDTLSDAAVALREYLSYDMCNEGFEEEIELFAKQMDLLRERYDAAGLGEVTREATQ